MFQSAGLMQNSKKEYFMEDVFFPCLGATFSLKEMVVFLTSKICFMGCCFSISCPIYISVKKV